MGLVLGKFAPLHKGHQRLVEASLAETEKTVVLIYDCEDLDTPPLQVRANWIRTLYPPVEVLEALGRSLGNQLGTASHTNARRLSPQATRRSAYHTFL